MYFFHGLYLGLLFAEIPVSRIRDLDWISNPTQFATQNQVAALSNAGNLTFLMNEYAGGPALTNRFKPEQIARLGNNFIVYPSLNTEAYMKIIRRACRSYTDEAYRVYGKKLWICDELPKPEEVNRKSGLTPQA